MFKESVEIKKQLITVTLMFPHHLPLSMSHSSNTSPKSAHANEGVCVLSFKSLHTLCLFCSAWECLACRHHSFVPSHMQDRSSWQADEPRRVFGLHRVNMVIWVLKLLLLPIDGCWYLVSEPMYLCRCHLRHFLLISAWTYRGLGPTMNLQYPMYIHFLLYYVFWGFSVEFYFVGFILVCRVLFHTSCLCQFPACFTAFICFTCPSLTCNSMFTVTLCQFLYFSCLCLICICFLCYLCQSWFVLK